MISKQDQIIPFPGTIPFVKGNDVSDPFSEKLVSILGESEHELDRITRGTESEFLLIGTKLRDFYTRLIHISEMSSTITNVFSSDEIVTTIGGLKELLEKIKTYHEVFRLTTQARIEQLDQISGIIKNIYEPLNDFQNITVTLRTLSTTTKIHSALIGNTASGFHILANDVKRLSMLIDARSDSIKNDLNTLQNLVRQTYSNLLLFEKLQNVTVKEIIDNTGVAISSLTEKYDASKSIAQDVSARANDMSRSIAELVTFLQIHDVTRQKFEHLGKSIRKTHEELGGEEAGTNPTFLLRSNFNIQTVLEERCTAFIASLSGILDEFISAVHNIITNLALIGTNISDIMKETKSLFGKIDSDHSTFINELEKSLSSVNSAVSSIFESAEADKDLSFAIKSLSTTTGQISEFIHDIKTIAADLRLISLNATIKAEEIGSSGASLSVVSDFIKQLAEDANMKSYAVSEALESIIYAVRELSSKADKWSLIDESDVKGMSERIAIMTNTFHVVNANIFSLLHDLDKDARQLASDIQEAAGNINVHITVDTIVRRIVSRFASIVNQVKQSNRSKEIMERQQEKRAETVAAHLLRTNEQSFYWPSTNDKTEYKDSEENVELF